jgi:SAM-dependent methyltransferase
MQDDQHNVEIHENLERWQKKPVLKKIYLEFYKRIVSHLNKNVDGLTVELGSGLGNLKMVVPDVICTDLFKNPWIDRVENAYHLSFGIGSVSNLILFDVFHHLEYPGSALKEFNRVLANKGRVIIFDPAISFFGLIVYGLFHHEPVALFKKIKWFAPEGKDLSKTDYYASQSNVSRIFCSSHYRDKLSDWNIVAVKRSTSLSYVLSGGYSKHQLYPDTWYPFMKSLDRFFDLFSFLFATRMLVVLEKKIS